MDSIVIKNISEKDLNDVVRLENTIWTEGTRATKDKFESRLRIFPQGFFLAYINGELIGVSTSETIQYDPSDPSSTPKSKPTSSPTPLPTKSPSLQPTLIPTPESSLIPEIVLRRYPDILRQR